MTDSPRYCAKCDAYGDHHTDRHEGDDTTGDDQ